MKTSNDTAMKLLSDGTTISIVTKNATILNLDTLNLITLIFLIAELVVIVISFGITLIFFSPRIKNNKKNSYCTACDNPLPCLIHENKSAPPF